DLVALHFLEGLAQRLARAGDLQLGLCRRLRELLAPRDEAHGIAGVAPRRLGRGGRGLLLADILGIEPEALFGELPRQLLEGRELPPALVELPSVEANEALERAHATGAARSAVSWA